MGCGSSSNILFNLDRKNAFYFAGEEISGTVQFTIDHEKLRAREIYLNLIGELGYKTATNEPNRDSLSNSNTEEIHIPFLRDKTIFAQPEDGEKELTFRRGRHSWPFKFQLPGYLPPTLHRPRTYPHVRYYLQFFIQKAWYKANTRENRYLTVFPRVDLLKLPPCLKATNFDHQNRKDLTFKGSLNKLGYVPGEMVIAKIEVDNPRQVLIKQIDCSMIKRYQIAGISHKPSILQATLPRFMNRRDERISETSFFVIPAGPLAPSYNYRGGITHLAVVMIEYVVKFEVKVEGLFTNFEVIVPITLGTEPNPPPTQQQGMNPLMVTYIHNAEESMFTDDDPPSSYNSVVRKNK